MQPRTLAANVRARGERDGPIGHAMRANDLRRRFEEHRRRHQKLAETRNHTVNNHGRVGQTKQMLAPEQIGKQYAFSHLVSVAHVSQLLRRHGIRSWVTFPGRFG